MYQDKRTRLLSRYEYNISDHLGNTRLTFTDKDGDGVVEIFENADSNEVLSESHYYPFGMQMNGTWMSNPGRSSKYRYNNKEFNQDFGVDWYDYGARWYDASIGRWNAVDPLAEDYASWSSFNYVLGNPIRLIDPDGARTIFYDSDGNELYRSADDELDDAIAIIDSKNAKFFNTVLNYMEEQNMLSTDDLSTLNESIETLRFLGQNYMVDGMKDLENYGESLPLTTKDNFLDPETDKALELIPEVSAKLKKEGNIFSVDMSTKGTSNYGTASPNYTDALTIHTHPNGGGVRFKSGQSGRTGTFGGEDGRAPSRADRDNNYGKFGAPDGYNIIVAPTIITLHGKGKSKIFVDKSFFNSKKP